MSVSQLEHKTIRPGSLGGYSYYHSNRNIGNAANIPAKRISLDSHNLKAAVVVVAAIILVYSVFTLLRTDPVTAVPQIQPAKPVVSSAAALPVSGNHCQSNKLDQLIKVSIGQRHLWACAGGKLVHEAPVITGMLAQDSTLTPPGIYHIYAKTNNTTLTGADETGSWNDPVTYWMPFLNNQHGTYGFHDATWRPADAFGKISPGSADASHGCVELPLATSKWLYNWAAVGTAVAIEN